MPAAAIGLVLVAAVLHAGWNVLLKTSGDSLSTAVRLQAIGTAILLPVAVVAWFANGRPEIPLDAAAIAVASGVIETIYFLCLSAAYRRGDLSLVYPIARGSAPLLAVIVGIAILGERLAPLALAGVACLLIGITLTARPWQVFVAAGRSHRGAIGFALATGASIAAYSAVDRVGVRLVAPWLYGAILAVASVAFLVITVRVGRGRGWLAPAPAAARASLARDAIAGVLAMTAYLLVLAAYALAPLATVAPLRESGIVLAAAWGSLRLREATSGRQAAGRIAASSLILVGAALLALSP